MAQNEGFLLKGNGKGFMFVIYKIHNCLMFDVVFRVLNIIHVWTHISFSFNHVCLE